MVYKIKFKKIIATLTTASLIVSFVVGPSFSSVINNEQISKEYKQIFKDFILPHSYGKITKAHFAGTDRVIINIQDLHCHPAVQKNISNIIETFDKSFGVNKLYLEGAYGEVDTSWLADAIKNDKSIAEKLLETGRLTGVEYYSAKSGKTKIIKGLEEKEEYLDNLKRFGIIVENQDKINLILEGIRESSEKIKAKYYDKKQYKLEKLSADYKDGKISSKKYYTLLNKHISTLGIDIYKYENTLDYMMLLAMQEELNYKTIIKELQSLILVFKEHLPYSTYKMLLEETENFSKVDKLQEYIIKIAREHNIDLSKGHKNLDKYLEYIELSRKINPLELVKEEKELTQEINTRFSQTKAQRDAVFLIYFEKYLEDYLNSSITADDYKYYQENIEKYKDLWNKYVDNRVLSLLDEYMLVADKFYKINEDRNNYFTDFILDSEEILSIEGNKEAKDDASKIIANMDEVKRVDIVVAGGFHTDSVSNILKNKGISYIVITPSVKDGTKEAKKRYYEIVKEQGKFSSQAFATLPLSLYGQEEMVLVSVKAFGRKTAERIFGVERVRDILSKSSPLSQEQLERLSFQAQKRQIEFAKILDSDDEGEVNTKIVELVKEYASEDLKDKVNEDLLSKADPVKLKEALSFGQKELDNLISLLSETNPIKKLILSLKSILPDLLKPSSADGKLQSSEIKDDEFTTYSAEEKSEIYKVLKEIMTKKVAFNRNYNSETAYEYLGTLDDIIEGYNQDIYDKSEILKRLIKKEGKINELGMYWDVAFNNGKKAAYTKDKRFEILKSLIAEKNNFSSEDDFDLAFSVFRSRIISNERKKEINNIKFNMYNFNLLNDNKSFDTLGYNSTNWLEDLVFCEFEIPKEDIGKIEALVKGLQYARINLLATENENFALQIFLNPKFQELTKNIEIQKDYADDSEFQNIKNVTQYRTAITLARMLYLAKGDAVLNLSQEDFNAIIEISFKYYLQIAEEAEKYTVLDEETYVSALYNEDERYSPNYIDGILKELGIYDGISQKGNIEHYKVGKNQPSSLLNSKTHFPEAESWLKSIADFPKTQKEKNIKRGYFSFNGHGFFNEKAKNLYYYKDEYQADNKHITAKELADALLKAKKNGANLKDITLDLSSCYSWYIANDIYKMLEEEGIKEFPQIITEAGFEDPLGDVVSFKGALLDYVKYKGIKGIFTLADFHKTVPKRVAHTVFVSNSKIQEMNENFKTELNELLQDGQISDEGLEQYKAKNLRQTMLQNKSIVKKLYEKGFRKYLNQYLERTGKSEENLTEEELSEIKQKARKYRHTLTLADINTFDNTEFVSNNETKKTKKIFKINFDGNLPVSRNIFSHILGKYATRNTRVFTLSIFKELANKYVGNEIFSTLNKTAPVWEEFLFRATPAMVALTNPFLGMAMFIVMQPLFIFSHTIVRWLVNKDSSKKSLKDFAKEDFSALAAKTLLLSLPYLIAMPLSVISPLFIAAATFISIFAHAINNNLAKIDLEVKYPGMSEEIMSKIINKINGRGVLFPRAVIRKIIISIFMESVGVPDMETLLDIVSDKSPEKINALFGNLVVHEFNVLATDNDLAPIKLFFDDEFNKLLDEKEKESNFEFLSDDFARYHVAIAVSRMSNEKEMSLEQATEQYFNILIESKDKKLIDSNTVLIGVYNNKKRYAIFQQFNTNVFEKLFGINIKPEHRFIQSEKRPNAKGDFLNTIAGLNEINKKYYIIFDGHGREENLFLTDKITINPDEMAQSLWQAYKNGIDLNNVTLELSSCLSYYFARNLYDALREIAQKEGEEENITYPTIITAAGREMKYGYTYPVFNDMFLYKSVTIGNFHNALRNTSIPSIKGRKELTLFDVVTLVEPNSFNSNITVFTRGNDIGIVSTLSSGVAKSKFKIVRENDKYNFVRLPDLPPVMHEFSIFKELADKYAGNKIFSLLNKTAPVWEEILFRAIPAIVAVTNPFIGISMFALMQPLFIFSHTIVRWLVNKDSNGKSFKDFVKEDFSAYAPKTVLLSLPYLIAVPLSIFSPLFIAAATFIATIVHIINNYSVKKYEETKNIKQNISYDKKAYGHMIFLIENANGDKIAVRFIPRTGEIFVSAVNGESYSLINSPYQNIEQVNTFTGVEFSIDDNTVHVTADQKTTNVFHVDMNEDLNKVLLFKQKTTEVPQQEELRLMLDETGTKAPVFVYLNDSEQDNRDKVIDAIENNKLLVIYPFSISYDISSLTDNEMLILYSSISRKFFDMGENLFNMLPRLKDNDFLNLGYFLKEMVKNAFVHGNFSDPSKPIYIACHKNNVSVYNAISDGEISDKEKQRRLYISAAATLTGQHKGILRAQKYKDVMSLTQKDVILGDKKYYVASVTMLEQSVTPESVVTKDEDTESSLANRQELSITEIVIDSAKKSASPSSTVQKISIRIVTGERSVKELEKNIADISSNLIITENEESAKKLRDQGFKAVTAEVVSERGGIPIGKHKNLNVRAKWNREKTKMLFCLKEKGVDVKKEELFRMLINILNEGRQTNILYGISQIVITKEETLDGVVNAIKNAHTDSIMKAVKETKFDLSQKHIPNIKNVCEKESSATGAKVFILNSVQEKQYEKDISSLREKGFRFVVAYGVNKEVDEIICDGAKVDASDIKDINEAKKFLSDLKRKALSKDAGLFLSVKFNDDVYKKFVEEKIDIFNEYGIIPIISADSKYLETSTLGKLEVEDITEKNIEQVLENDSVVTIVVDDATVLSDKKEKLKQVKTNGQKYNKGYNASLSSTFDYTTQDMNGLLELLKVDINSEEKDLAELLKNIPIEDMGLSQDSRSYIKYLLERESYQEVLGFIRGIVMNSAQKILMTELSNMQITIDESKFKNANDGMFKKAMLTLLVQLLMEDNDINSLLQDDYTADVTMTAKQYLDSIMTKVNENIEKIIKDNEYKINKLSNNAEAIIAFKQFNLLMQDRFRKAIIVKNVKISALEVRRILTAA